MALDPRPPPMGVTFAVKQRVQNYVCGPALHCSSLPKMPGGGGTAPKEPRGRGMTWRSTPATACRNASEYLYRERVVPDDGYTRPAPRCSSPPALTGTGDGGRGYMSQGIFAPEPRYSGRGAPA